MAYARTYERLWLCSLTEEQRTRTCSYWYTVTDYGSTPHTAFRTKAALLTWLQRRGLEVEGDIPEHGVWGSFRIKGGYRQSMHLDEQEFYRNTGEHTRELSNGDFTLGIITKDPDGLRTVHTLNPNVRTRPVFDYRQSQEFQDAGS
jgi:hypothetical protein